MVSLVPQPQRRWDAAHWDLVHRVIHDALCLCDFSDDCELKPSYRDAANELMNIRDKDIAERDAEIARLRAEIARLRAAPQDT